MIVICIENETVSPICKIKQFESFIHAFLVIISANELPEGTIITARCKSMFLSISISMRTKSHFVLWCASDCSKIDRCFSVIEIAIWANMATTKSNLSQHKRKKHLRLMLSWVSRQKTSKLLKSMMPGRVYLSWQRTTKLNQKMTSQFHLKKFCQKVTFLVFSVTRFLETDILLKDTSMLCTLGSRKSVLNVGNFSTDKVWKGT